MKKKLVLYTFPPVPNSYSFTPFGLKAESFLRINNIPYEKCYTTSFGRNKTIPYLRMLDDDPNAGPGDYQEVSDSNEMIAFLLKDADFDTGSCQENLTKQQEAISHAFIRMIEEHTSQTGFYYRYYLQMPAFCNATRLRERAFMGDKSRFGSTIFGLFKKGMVKGWERKAKARGFMRYSGPNVVWAMAGKDLKSLEDLFVSTPNRNYFFGLPYPSILDCVVFGHLSQFLYIDMDSPQKDYLSKNCPGLLLFMEHFKQTYFPDWESLCERQPNDGLRDDSPRVIKMKNMLKHAAFGMVATFVAAGAAVYHRYTHERKLTRIEQSSWRP